MSLLNQLFLNNGKPSYTTSAKIFSLLLKYISPEIKIKILENDPIKIRDQGIAEVPSKAHLKPSITPAMGYNPYNKYIFSPYFSSSIDEGHTTGAEYIINWVKNVIACLTSRN